MAGGRSLGTHLESHAGRSLFTDAMTEAPDAGAQTVPEHLLSLAEFEDLARDALAGPVFEYYAGGSGDEWTLAENRRAFSRWALRPRVGVDVSRIDATATVLGTPVPFPVLLAPVAFQRMAHPEGEVASGRAAAAVGTIAILSTSATATIEEVAATGVHLWFQLYVQRDRAVTVDLVQRAHAAGCKALVLTLDAPVLGRRERDERNRFALPAGLGLANLQGRPLPEGEGSGLAAYSAAEVDPSLTWETVSWVRSISRLPLVVKGLLRPDDAIKAVEAGASGIVISNHGGRQLDGAIAALEALPDIVDAAGDRAEVLVDGGVRRGVDVVKAVALGARAVLIGRPYVWGLAVGGERGVGRVLAMLGGEISLAMALAGAPRLSDLDRSFVVWAPHP